MKKNADGTWEKYEPNLPFKMADLYAYTRTFINRRRFLKIVFALDVYSFLAGVIIWGVWTRCDMDTIAMQNGQTFGLYSYGVFMTMCVVISHHGMVVINTRNWGIYLTGWAIFSICMMPLNLWLA